MRHSIVILGPAYPYRGGIAQYTTLLYRELKKNHEVSFFSFSRQYPSFLYPGSTDKDPSSSPLGESDVIHYTIDSMNPITWLATARSIIRIHPELVIIPWWVAFWTPQIFTIASLIRLRTKAKILFICHNVVEHESSMVTRFCTKLVLKKGHFFMVHSGEDERNLYAIIPGARVTRHHLPVNTLLTQRYPALNKDEAKNRVSLSGKKVMLFFGFVRQYKGLDCLLRSLPAVIAKIPDAQLLIVGEFWKDKAQYDDIIYQLNINQNVTIIDRYISDEEIPLYFCAADVVVAPYRTATGSAVVPVAYGYGRPVVVTAVGSLPEIVEHGKTGLVIPPDNEKALADALVTVFTDSLYEKLAGNVATGKTRLSWDAMVEAIERFADEPH
ncbi:MAG: glycosyltransferase family 4 protein [Candidatus Auribacterota bacterium]